MTVAELWLRPATQDEVGQWLPRQEAAYAREIAESGAMPAAAAAEKARADIARRFSGGMPSPGQVLWRLMAGDQPVGWLWLNVPAIDNDPLMAWVNDIEVDPEYRGRGYGRAAMLLAEREARVRGMTSLGLNVHGQNTAARSLYESLGYQVMTQQMRKPLSPLRGGCVSAVVAQLRPQLPPGGFRSGAQVDVAVPFLVADPGRVGQRGHRPHTGEEP
jgi:ribosomal protein S18 acetylase RimI-like enzyme